MRVVALLRHSTASSGQSGLDRTLFISSRFNNNNNNNNRISIPPLVVTSEAVCSDKLYLKLYGRSQNNILGGLPPYVAREMLYESQISGADLHLGRRLGIQVPIWCLCYQGNSKGKVCGFI